MELSSKEIGVLDRLECDAVYQKYFFDHAKDVKWLYCLKDRKYFDPNSIECDQDNNSYFWPPLKYLEKVANQINENPKGKEEYAKELLVVIGEVVEFSRTRRSKGKTPINNYGIWWFLVKILDKIPNDIIKNEVKTEQFTVWMQEFTNPIMHANLAVSEIIRLWLPKFLNQDMKEYAGVVIKALTRIQPSQKKNSLVRQEDAKLVLLDRWLGDELSKHADKIGEYCDEGTIQDLLDQLRNALEYHSKEQFRTFKVGENAYYRVTLTRLKKKGIEEGSIEYQEGRFSGLVQKYTADELNSVNLDNDYELYRKDPTGESQSFEIHSIKDEGSFKEQFKSLCSSGDLKNLSLNKTNNFEVIVGYLYESFFIDHSYIWFSSLDILDIPKDCLGSGAHDILSIFCSKVFLAKCKSNKAIGKNLINIITSVEIYKFSIFGRMVLFVIDKLWDKYEEIFNKQFLDNFPDLLEGSDYRLEISYLFRNHAVGFNSKVLKELNKRIQNPPQWYQKKSKEVDDEKILLRWQYEWVVILKDVDDFKPWYKELSQIFKEEPQEYTRPSGGFKKVIDYSPKNKDQILDMDVLDLVKLFDDFEGARDIWEQTEGKPSKEGLAREFRLAVKEQPKKYSNQINLFKDARFGYI